MQRDAGSFEIWIKNGFVVGVATHQLALLKVVKSYTEEEQRLNKRFYAQSPYLGLWCLREFRLNFSLVKLDYCFWARDRHAFLKDVWRRYNYR